MKKHQDEQILHNQSFLPAQPRDKPPPVAK
jgi:hypothetical protein